MTCVPLRYSYAILSLKSERKRLFERLRCRWEHNVNVCVCVCEVG